MINFGKLWRFITGKTNDAIDKVANDAGTEARQIQREYASQIATAESSLIDVKATYEVLQGKKTTAEAEVKKWADAAQVAVNRDDDALARECLEAKKRAATQLGLIQDQIDAMEPQLTALEERIDELQAESNAMANEVDVIQATSDVNKASQKAAATLTGIGSKNLKGDFQSVRDRVAKDSARTKAVTERADKNSGKALEKKVAALTTASSVDDELAALKAKKS